MNLPTRFVKTVTSTFAGGAEWLARLPELLAACERRWELTVRPSQFTLSYNYVAPATLADGTEIVLKVGVPNRELRTEIEALRLYDGRGCVRLLAADPDQGVLLLERLYPGAMLTTITDDDDAATRMAAQVMQTLWRPLPAEHSFPSVADWAGGLAELREAFGGGTGPFEERMVETAESLFTDLLTSSSDPVLLHGDLHHYNILSAGDGWRVIDPKGVAGEPAYEVGALLRNPFTIFDEPELKRITARRLDILAETLNMDRERLRQWSLAQAVLSAWWGYEDGGSPADWEPTMRLAAVLATL